MNSFTGDYNRDMVYANMPQISIIIPVYNVEKYLRKCLDSVLAQTYGDFEVILVNDGSTDHCGIICDEYSEKDARIKVIHKENGGLSDARNVALDITRGKYITFIDSDDYVLPEHLQSMIQALIETGSDLAVTNIVSVTDDAQKKAFYTPTTERLLLEGKSVFDTLNQPCACAKLYKRQIFENIRFPYGKLYEDAFIYHDVLEKATKLVFTGQSTYCYLTREGSILHQKYKLAFTDIIDAVVARIKKLEELGLLDLANENRGFIYSKVAVAYANLDKSIPENQKRLKQIKKIYDREYPALMKQNVGIKQKLRYWFLHSLPSIHTMLYGKRMNIL